MKTVEQKSQEITVPESGDIRIGFEFSRKPRQSYFPYLSLLLYLFESMTLSSLAYRVHDYLFLACYLLTSRVETRDDSLRRIAPRS